MQVSVETVFKGAEVFEINYRDSETKLYVDKKQNNYSPQGPNPLELFLSALSSCMGVYAKRYLLQHKLSASGLKIEARALLTDKAPMHLANIEVNVQASAIKDSDKEDFLRYVKNCPIHNTILFTKEISVKII